jgi:transcriptional antiterminator NusG
MASSVPEPHIEPMHTTADEPRAEYASGSAEATAHAVASHGEQAANSEHDSSKTEPVATDAVADVPEVAPAPQGPVVSPLVRGSSSDRTLSKPVEEESPIDFSSYVGDEADEGETLVVSRSRSSESGGSKKRSPGKSKVIAEAEVPGEPVEKSENMKWYILKVQSNREESIREGLLRRVAIQGLSRFFGDVIVPTEKVTEFKGGKKRVIKRKLYPGYLVVNMEINEETWFLVRETTGIGDFTGASGHPTPMLPHEVDKIVAKQEEKSEKAPKLKISFNAGERVKINEGTFENFEGEVESIDETNGIVTVMINIFGRSTPVQLEYWQVEVV